MLSRLVRRLFILLVFAAVVGLWVAVVIEWQRYSDEAPPGLLARRVPADTRAEIPRARPSPTPRPRRRTRVTKRRAATKAVRRVPVLTVQTEAGSSWLEVRRGSESGRLLYIGNLAPGGRLRYRAQVLWLRVGAGEYVAVRRAGRQVGDVPAGTATIRVTPRRIETLALG